MDATFVVEEVEPLDLVFPHHDHRVPPPWLKKVIDPLKDQVRGAGAVGLPPRSRARRPGIRPGQAGLMNEILGRSYSWAPTIFGMQGPTPATPRSSPTTARPSRRSATSAAAGRRHRSRLLDDRAAGRRRPQRFRCRAARDGDEWVIDGEKLFSSNATLRGLPHRHGGDRPRCQPHKGCRCSSCPADTPGINIVRRRLHGRADEDAMTTRTCATTMSASRSTHMLGGAGDGFKVAQTRLGGRPHPPRDAHRRAGAAARST